MPIINDSPLIGDPSAQVLDVNKLMMAHYPRVPLGGGIAINPDQVTKLPKMEEESIEDLLKEIRDCKKHLSDLEYRLSIHSTTVELVAKLTDMLHRL